MKKHQIYVAVLALATSFISSQVAACEVEVNRLMTLNTIATRGIPTAGMTIVEVKNPVFTGAVDDRNKYMVDLIVESSMTNKTFTIYNVETEGRCK